MGGPRALPAQGHGPRTGSAPPVSRGGRRADPGAPGQGSPRLSSPALFPRDRSVGPWRARRRAGAGAGVARRTYVRAWVFQVSPRSGRAAAAPGRGPRGGGGAGPDEPGSRGGRGGRRRGRAGGRHEPRGAGGGGPDCARARWAARRRGEGAGRDVERPAGLWGEVEVCGGREGLRTEGSGPRVRGDVGEARR